MNDLGRWIEQALAYLRHAYWARQTLAGCGTLIMLVIFGLYYLFSDQQL